MTDKELLDIAVAMLADWCFAVEIDGESWDTAELHYRRAARYPGPLRALIDAEIERLRMMDIDTALDRALTDRR